MPAPIQIAGGGVDLSARYVASTTIVGSPAAAAETIVASVTLPRDLTITQGVYLLAVVAFTVGTSGTAANLRIRQTDTSGTVLYSTGAATVTAANLVNFVASARDTSPAANAQVYVATLTVTAGAAASTVSAVFLSATII